MNKRILTVAAATLLSACTPAESAPAMQAAYQGFSSPTGIVAQAGEAVYVSDWSANTVTRIGKDGSHRVVAQGIAAPAGLALDKQGRLYIASYSGDYITRLEADGSLKSIAENLATPTGIAFAQDGRLLIANRATGQVLALNTENGKTAVLADGFDLPVGVAQTADGSIVVSQYGGRVTRIKPDGGKQELGQEFNRPGVGIAADGVDAVWVADNGASVVRRVDFNGKTTTVSPKLDGSVVALGKGINGEWLAGAWGSGKVYRLN